MEDKYLTNWGQRGVPLLPKSLREAWAEDCLPKWVTQESKLPEGTKLGSLSIEIWNQLPEMTERLERYLLALIETRMEAISSLPALGRPWLHTLDPDTVPWRTRTRNSLKRAGLLVNKSQLSYITFSELLALPGMGTVSLLDFATTAEAAMERLEQIVPQKVNAMTNLVLSMVDAPWTELITAEDPRFAQFFPGRHGSLSQYLETILVASSGAGTDIISDGISFEQLPLFSEGNVRAILEYVQKIQQMPLDVALRDYMAALSRFEDGRLDVLLARFGWSGSPPVTLRECAVTMNVSRERVRQIQESLAKKRPSHPVFLPALERALEVLAEIAPIDSYKAAEKLKERGIATMPFSPEGVLTATEFCGHAATFELESSPRGVYVITSAKLVYASRVKLLATRSAGASGCTNVAEVSAEAAKEDILVDSRQVGEVLKQYTSAQFLDDNEEWFWMPDGKPHRNRLYNVTKKLLSVASPLDLNTIREGIRRQYLQRNLSRTLTVPPRSVLAAFYATNPAFVVEDDGQISSAVLLDYRKELGLTEQVFVEVLRTTPTCMLDRQSFIKECGERGVNLNTVNAMLTFSPIIQRVDTGIWGLRGVHVDPVTVTMMRESLGARTRERRTYDYGWAPNGNLWIAARLPSILASYTLYIPSVIGPFLYKRRFPVQSEDGSTEGIIVVDDRGMSWGYGPFLSRHGADENDILLVEFDLVHERVILKLETEEFLDEPFVLSQESAN